MTTTRPEGRRGQFLPQVELETKCDDKIKNTYAAATGVHV